MTGVNYKKIRHYAPGIQSKQTRLDPDFSAILFKAGVRVTSSAERLIADVSIKAAMPTLNSSNGDSDGKKRGLQSASESTMANIQGVVFDPKGKKESGTYLKLHVTEPERKQALISQDPKANFGWVKFGESNSIKSPRGVKVNVSRQKLDPRSGKPIASTGHDPFDPFAPYMNNGMRVKGLGESIGQSNSGSKLIHFTARAAGVVVDALGKFRCPEGTPAANRFTNERGEGCFAVNLDQLKNIATSLASIVSGSVDERGSITENLMRQGVNVGEIRRIYRESGMRGLASLASKISGLGGEGHRFGEKYYDDPSYRASIAPKLRETMRLTEGASERMAIIRRQKKETLTKLMADYKIVPSGDEEKDIIALLEKIGADDKFGLAADGHEFYVGGSKESHEKFLIEKFFITHEEAVQKYFPDIKNSRELQDRYETDKKLGVETPLTKAIDAMINRDREMKIGALEQIAIDATERPDSLKKVIIQVDPASLGHNGPENHRGFLVLNGMSMGDILYIGPGPAIEGHRGTPPEGSIDLYTATGGTQEEQWQAIAAAIQADETGRHWAHTFGVDLAAIQGEGWRDFGAQTAAHEAYHFQQVLAIKEYLIFNQATLGITEDIGSMDNSELFNLAHAFLENASPQMLREALGADIEDLISARLDGIAGAYSGVSQQDALAKIEAAKAGVVTVKDANMKRSLALLETMAELGANSRVGLVGIEIDELVNHVFHAKRDEPESFSPPRIPGEPLVPDTPLYAPRPMAWGVPWWTPEEVPGNSGTGGGGQRGPHDPFSGRRTSEIAKKIREGTLTTDDLDELLYGKDRGNKNKDGSPRKDGGILQTWRAADTSPTSRGDATSKSRRRDLKEILDELEVDEGLLADYINKLQKGEVLSHEEEDRLVDSINKLSVKYNELSENIEKISAAIDAGCPSDIRESDRGNYNDVSNCGSWFEGMTGRKKGLEYLHNKIGRGLRPLINDIWDVNEHIKTNGPLPYIMKYVPTPGYYSASRVASLQESRLSPEEISIASSAVMEVPLSVMSSIDVPGYLDDALAISQTYSSYGIKPPVGISFDDLETVVPLIKVIDKSDILETLIAEFEIDWSNIKIKDYKLVGSVIETSGVRKLTVFDSSEDTGEFASTSRRRAAVVGRLLDSEQSRKLMRTIGLDPENEELISLAAETALAFSMGGPAGAIIPIARKAGIDSGEKALQMMVSKGWITQSIASKINSYGLDKIAKEGLPKEIIQLMKNLGDSVSSRENKHSALKMATVLEERSREIKETSKRTLKKIKDTVSEMRESSSQNTVTVSGPQDARKIIERNLPAAVKTEREAYTILVELAKMANESKAAKEAGEPDVKIPNYDFCKVSIPGTNLFCGDSKGIPRKKMPQFSGEPTPGSPADSKPKNKKGEVDGTDDFIKHMEGLGVKVEEKEVLASTLRASQNELVGEKVAGMMTNEGFDPAGEAIFVSRDGYVIDGHHRWAAQVGRDLEDGNIGDLPLSVRVVDMDISEVLEEANRFAQEFGIAPKTAGNDAVVAKSAFINIQFKQLGETIKPNEKSEKEKNTRKQKVRVVVPKGSKAKVDKSGEILIPPGKMKVTGVDEDGVVEAEITTQMSAIEYMQNVEKRLSEKISAVTEERAKKLLSSEVDKYKKTKRDAVISSPDASFSNISRATLEKANTIIESALSMNYSLFNEKDVYVSGEKIAVSEYYDLFIKSVTNTILEIKKDFKANLFPEDKEFYNFITSNSESFLYSILVKIAVSLFEEMDRRTRISMSTSSLQAFLTNGRIANVDVDSKMLSEMKKNKDKIIGGTVSSSEFSLTPVNLMHKSQTKLIEQSLYFAGTRVGSEEFADYGRGIEVVLRSENAKRIGYGRSDNEENEGLYSLITDDNEERIVMTIFGNIVKGGELAKNIIISAIDLHLNKDYKNFLNPEGENILDGFIVGEISLNDIEHIKIPVSIFKIINKTVSPSHPFAGKNRISSSLGERGMKDSEIKEFFDKGGIIGGGYNPKYLIYLLQVEAAKELKDRLISFGIAEVIFTNKSGIDIMAEKTWFTPAPDAAYGLKALQKLAEMEINVIIEKTMPRKKKSTEKKNTEKEKASL